MEPSTGIKTWQWVVTVIVIIVLIIIGIMVFGNGKQSPDETMTNETPIETPVSLSESDRVVVGDQFPGNVVFLSSVQLTKGGWVVIHKDNAGTPGDIIGSKYFEKGINTGQINLTKQTVDGGLYYAMLHSDNGDKIFDPTKDLPLKDSKGNIIMKPFRASAGVEAGIKG